MQYRSAKILLVNIVVIASLLMGMHGNAAVRDEAIEGCFSVDDGNEFTTDELICLRLLDLGSGMYTGTGVWRFKQHPHYRDDPIDMELVLTVSGYVKDNGSIEITVEGSDFGRSVSDNEHVKRFTHAILRLNPDLSGLGTGYTVTENEDLGYYPLDLASTECP